MMKIILAFYHEGLKWLEKDLDLSEAFKFPVRTKIARLKYIAEDNLEEFDSVEKELKGAFAKVLVA